jgi:hypothetical protein
MDFAVGASCPFELVGMTQFQAQGPATSGPCFPPSGHSELVRFGVPRCNKHPGVIKVSQAVRRAPPQFDSERTVLSCFVTPPESRVTGMILLVKKLPQPGSWAVSAASLVTSCRPSRSNGAAANNLNLNLESLGIATRMCDFKFPPLRASPSRMIEAGPRRPAPPRGGQTAQRARGSAGRAPNFQVRRVESEGESACDHRGTESYPT